MSSPTVPPILRQMKIRAMDVGEPQRKWYIVPREIPVPAPPAHEETPAPEPLPVLEPELEPERVG